VLCRYRHNGHWSGAPHRLARDLSGNFASKSYGKEELVAEMISAFVCASLGITPTVRHAEYLGAWLEILREDNHAIIRAASAASTPGRTRRFLAIPSVAPGSSITNSTSASWSGTGCAT